MLPVVGEDIPAAYLVVRLPPHPPSWHIYHRQHAWIPPFAFNGAAARHPSVVASAGGHREHRWALAGSGGFSLAHVSIVLLSFCPVLAYLLVTAAFQRRTALYTPINSSMESCARDARKPASKEVPEFTGPTPTVAGRTPTPVRGWWAKHWSALLEDDNVQVAISSLSAAAASNVFYAPGTARKSTVGGDHELGGKETEEEAKEADAGEDECRRSAATLAGARRQQGQNVGDIHLDGEQASDTSTSPLPLPLGTHAPGDPSRRQRRRREKRPSLSEGTGASSIDVRTAVDKSPGVALANGATDNSDGSGGGGGDGGHGDCSSCGRKEDRAIAAREGERSGELTTRPGREAEANANALKDSAIAGGAESRGMASGAREPLLRAALVLISTQDCLSGADDIGGKGGSARTPARGSSGNASKKVRARRRSGKDEADGSSDKEEVDDAGTTAYRLPYGL